MSSDTRHEGPDGEPIDPEGHRLPDPSDIHALEDDYDRDPDGVEETVMARIPDEILASARARKVAAGESPPSEGENDALINMLLDDAADASRAEEAAPSEPPPVSVEATPDPPLQAGDGALEADSAPLPPEVVPTPPPVPAPAAARPAPPRRPPGPPPPRRPPAPPRAPGRTPPPLPVADRTPPPRSTSQRTPPPIPASQHTPAVPSVEEVVPEDDSTVRQPPPVAPKHDKDAPTLDMDPGSHPVPHMVESQPSSRSGPLIPSRRPPPVAFDREEDASALILRTHQRDDWVARADWLKAEADALDDKTAKARGLLVVSELLAMGGEDARARGVADEARELAPNLPLTHRQVRGLLAREADWAGVLEVLDAETRVSPTPAARCHGSLFGADICRLSTDDGEGAKKRLEVALRVLPSDPRAHVQRFCDMLAEPDGVDPPAPLSKFRLPDAPEIGPLAEATQQVLAHRGLPVRAQRPIGSSYEALLRVRTAITSGDHGAAVTGLEGLVRSESLAGGAGWLAGVLAAARKETRARSVEAFRGVIEGSHGAAARRALAARAIELGDAVAARSATDAGGTEAFSAADRIVLAALSGGTRADVEPWIEALLGDPELAPIASAASAALPDANAEGRSVQPVGSVRSRTASTLGRAMAASGSNAGLRSAVLAYADVAPESAIARALSLELDLDDGNGGRVSRAVASWRDDEGDRERTLAAALIAEAAGELERAKAEFERVRSMDVTTEAVARASAAHVPADVAARILAEHAQGLEAGTRAALLLTEAAVRLSGRDGAEAGSSAADDRADAEALLRRAAEIDPALVIAHHLGERAARARDDRGTMTEWIRARREASADPLEQAYDLVREAQLLAEQEPAAAATLLEAALRARPKDIGLRERFERLSPDPLPDRAAWRVERAAEATGPEAARLAMEAAFELEWAGDLEGAARAARQAIAAGEDLLAPIAAYRAAIAGQGVSDLIDALLPRASESTDPKEQLELYERLAELDERGRGDIASGLLWRRSILEKTPGHLSTLRRVASALISAGREEELDPIAIDLARTLEGPEAIAHAMLSARLRLRASTWDDTREPVEIAYRSEPRNIWALRQMAAHARAQGIHGLALEADRQLIDRTQRASEAATLSLRAAQSAIKAGLTEDALAFLGQSIELVPAHLVAHLEIASLLEQTGNAAGAASALEAAASACESPSERANNLYRAAILWHDKVSDVAHARQALESVAELDPSYGDVFSRLQAIYIAEGARGELAALLKRRLDAVTDPAERVEMEVLRGRALADVGDGDAAKQALAAALAANPDHIEALAAFGDVSAVEGDWAGAEQAWIRLARLVSEPERQTAIYFRLGGLYDDRLPNPERAEAAYQAILERAPGDTKARERLVALFQRTGDSVRAIEQQTLLINAAEAPEEKCERTTELARIYELSGDAKKAEATLLQARKTWPKDEVALGALARFYQRNNQAQTATVLLDRAVADARRALSTGRFEPYLFSTVATVAELRSRPDAARVAKAAVAALEGADAVLEGAGAEAGDPQLDELLAPDVMTPAFRDLLRLTGPLLDTAVPFDLAAVRAALLPPQNEDIAEQVRGLSVAYGLPGTQIYVSSALGSVCVPVSAHPPAIVLGHALVATNREDVRSFLLHRALKILQTNAAALSRTAPIDLWPLIAAYLKTFSPTWAPQGVDAGKLGEFQGRIGRALPHGLDPQVGILAADVIGSIGNRASTLNTVINGWGNRAGLLAVGDLNVSIVGIAWAGGHANAPPTAGKDRTTWIGRNAEARELIVFSVSDGYADARTRLGLKSE